VSRRFAIDIDWEKLGSGPQFIFIPSEAPVRLRCRVVMPV